MSDTIIKGDGWAAAHLDTLGDGPGFRKVRTPLGVTAFGVNAIVLPPGMPTRSHRHERQEELYFIHRGAIEFRFEDGTAHTAEAGSFVRVDAATARVLRNPSADEDAVYVCVGGEGGYVGRDGVSAEAELPAAP